MKSKISTLRGNYSIDDLYCVVTQTYEKYDEGQIPDDEAVATLLLCCRQFLLSNDISEHQTKGE